MLDKPIQKNQPKNTNLCEHPYTHSTLDKLYVIIWNDFFLYISDPKKAKTYFDDSYEIHLNQVLINSNKQYWYNI